MDNGSSCLFNASNVTLQFVKENGDQMNVCSKFNCTGMDKCRISYQCINCKLMAMVQEV